jgi:predicted lipoprotein with Yx(FWY)xxD motif
MKSITPRLVVLPLILVAGLLVLAGCGGGDDSESPSSEDAAMKKEEAAAMKEEAAMEKEEAAMKKEDEAMKEQGAAAGKATTITVGDSEFGEMIFDSNRQAIYIFQNDSKNQSACYGECAAAWPPVLTKSKPQADEGVDAALLGTVERRDGSLQVTYAGQPLYYYANEGPGEVGCHNVDLNGGFWWAVGPDGKRLA